MIKLGTFTKNAPRESSRTAAERAVALSKDAASRWAGDEDKPSDRDGRASERETDGAPRFCRRDRRRSASTSASSLSEGEV